MAKKIGLLILIIIISIILASIYGILHNQASYNISEEYFTNFKFDQFGLWENGYGDERLKVSIVGVLSTWWFGLIMGIINGLIGINQQTIKLMIKGVVGATTRILISAFIFGILGVFVGYIILSKLHFDWNIPSDLVDPSNFLAVGTMHTLSYLGGMIGLIYGIKYQLKTKKASDQQRRL
ncbi:hypothetical protein [Seonamhaeicola sp. ML3]|uniref:hypothetical protein n=1 Tax=Seonamhaeicola sp. ML3 TaxID=2937786 RepID=UPI00200ED80F|nr:hypothetical protein [Seonamhaeicola sp. ML3]